MDLDEAVENPLAFCLLKAPATFGAGPGRGASPAVAAGGGAEAAGFFIT